MWSETLLKIFSPLPLKPLPDLLLTIHVLSAQFDTGAKVKRRLQRQKGVAFLQQFLEVSGNRLPQDEPCSSDCLDPLQLFFRDHLPARHAAGHEIACCFELAVPLLKQRVLETQLVNFPLLPGDVAAEDRDH